MLQSRHRQIDAPLLILWLNLVAIGLLMIHSTTNGASGPEDPFSLASTLGRQLVSAAVAVVAMLFLLTVSADFWRTFALPIYLVSLGGLVLVLIFGSEIKGARAWFDLGPFSFQPAEFAKVGTLLAVAAYLNNFITDLREWRHQGVAALILLAPISLILLQPDAGSALVFLAFLVPMFRAGLPPGYFILGIVTVLSFLLPLLTEISLVLDGILFVGLAGVVLSFDRRPLWAGALLLVLLLFYAAWLEGLAGLVAGLCGAFFILFGVLAWRRGNARNVVLMLIFMAVSSGLAYSSYQIFHHVLLPHQKERINVWLNPEECDPRGALYNVLQSKLAIASGGLEGKGFLEGNITKLNYVPEQSTDFIFCAIGEEQGFIGTLGVIVLYTLLVLRILQVGERQRTDFGRYYAYGLAGLFFLHYTVNIGMTVGLAPVIGIPLPFISKGGSSLLFFTLLLGILLKLDYSDRAR